MVLNRAVAKFYKLWLFGGGKDKALTELRRAEALFERQPHDPTWPNWGRVEVQTWIGFVLAHEGELKEARAAYDRALVLAPGHSRVLEILASSEPVIGGQPCSTDGSATRSPSIRGRGTSVQAVMCSTSSQIVCPSAMGRDIACCALTPSSNSFRDGPCHASSRKALRS